MPHRTLTKEELTGYLHLLPGDVDRLLRESDIPHSVRGGRVLFVQSEIDAWASRRILGLRAERLDAYHKKSTRAAQEIFPESALIPTLLAPKQIDLALPAKTRASVIRAMVALAERTGWVFDPRELLETVEAREAICPTALPGGIALLHARQQSAYRFEQSFIVLGRTIQPIPFGAPDGWPTSLFFLICSQDERIHLPTLARLCLIALKTDVVTRLLDAADADGAYEALVTAENAVLPGKTG